MKKVLSFNKKPNRIYNNLLMFQSLPFLCSFVKSIFSATKKSTGFFS